jgi:type IV pilus assembly protein PilN
MRISVNLATRPFVELRPLFARLRLATAALALTAVALGYGLHRLNANARVEQAQMRELKVQTSIAENERRANEARMMEPQNRAVLDRSKFLNGLFESKSFSWTAVMMDLENVLPAGVQVTSIEPGITPEGGVNIHLRVSGPRELQVDLVRNLERSQRFLAPHVSNETAQTEEQGRLVQTSGAGVPGGVQFDIVSGYNPLPPPDKTRAPKDTARQQDTSGGQAAAKGHTAVAGHGTGPAKKNPASGGPR